jgi:hypothetical protein
MAEKNGLVPVVAKELRPHAIWTLIMWIAPPAGATMIAALVALLQKARHVSLDWFIIGGMFVLSIGVLALLLYLAKKLSREHTQQQPRTVLATPLSSSVPADVLGDVVTPTALASIPAHQVNPIPFPATVSLFTYEVPVGNVQDVGKTRIEVREIRKNKSSDSLQRVGEGEYGAVLYMISGGGVIWGGERVTEISTNCYYLPLNPMQSVKEPYSIYYHHFGENFLFSFAVYLEHINPHSGIVTMKACEVRSA